MNFAPHSQSLVDPLKRRGGFINAIFILFFIFVLPNCLFILFYLTANRNREAREAESIFLFFDVGVIESYAFYVAPAGLPANRNVGDDRWPSALCFT